MHPYQNNPRNEELVREIQHLEDAYAEALGDEADIPTLSSLWERIKQLNKTIIEGRRTDRTCDE